MRRTFWLLYTLVFAVTLLFAKDTVKIGVILPLSGDQSQVGQPELAAIKLFENDLQTHNYKHDYKLIVEDDQFIPRLTAEATNKLLNSDHVDAMACYGIAPGNVIAPRTAKIGIPMMCVNASYPKIANGKNNFLHWPPVEQEAEKLALLMTHMHFKTVGILSDRNPGILAIVNEIKEHLKAHGLDIVIELDSNPGERDFRTMLMRIAEKKPDVFLPFALSPELDIILRQRQQAGLTSPVVTFECFNFLADKNLANGCYYVSPSIGTVNFQKRLKTVTGQESGYSVAHFYDALDLIRQAYEHSWSIDRARACEWLKSLKDYPSAVGNITMDAQGIIHSPVEIFQMRTGQPVEVKIEDIK